MAKTRTEKIEGLKEEITQHQNQIKRLLQAQRAQDRKDRTRRLCERMGLFESMLPDTITLTADHFKTFLEKAILTEQSRRILDGLLTAQNAATPAPQGAGSAASDTTSTPASKTPFSAQENGEDSDEDEGNGEAETL